MTNKSTLIRENELKRQYLLELCPWLSDQDEPVRGSDVVDILTDEYEWLTRSWDGY